MKTIQFEGQTHQFPDDFTDQDISDALSTAPAAPSTTADVVKSVGSNLAEGAINVAGLPGTVGGGSSGGLIGNLVRKGLRAVGVPNIPSEENAAAAQAKALGGPDIAAPSGQTIQSTIEQATGPLGYEPTTQWGKYAGAGARQLPMAALMPGSAIGNLAVGALSGVAGEGAGQLAEKVAPNNPGLSTAARIVAPMVAGGIASGPVNAVVNRAGRQVQDLRALGDTAYENVKTLGVTLEPAAVSSGMGSIKTAITDKFGKSAPQTKKLLANEQAQWASPEADPMAVLTGTSPAAKAPVTTDDLKNIRERLGVLAQGDNATERYAARMAQEKLDNWLANISKKPGAVLTGDADEAAKGFQDARAIWAAHKRSEMIGGRIELGDLNAATAGSGRNVDNAGRQAIKTLIRPNVEGKTIAQKSGFNPAEIAQMNRVARGDTLENWMRRIGAGGLTHGALGVGGAYQAWQNNDPRWLIPFMIAGGAKRISGGMTKKQERLLDEMVRSRIPSNYQVTAPVTPLGMGTTGALLGLNSALGQNR